MPPQKHTTGQELTSLRAIGAVWAAVEMSKVRNN